MRRKPIRTEKELKKAIRKRFLQLVLEGTLMITAILLFSNSVSVGWFSSNKEVEAIGMQSQITATDLKAEFTVYVYNSKTGTAETVNTRENGLVPIQMPAYDTVFTNRNRYTSVVVRARLTGTELLVKGNNTIHFTIERNVPASTATQPPETSCSVLRFTGAADTDFFSDDPTTLWKSVDEKLYSTVKPLTGNHEPANTLGSSKVFVTQSESNYVAASSVVIDVPYNKNNLTSTDENGKPFMDVYLYISYDSALAQLYAQNHPSGGGFFSTENMANDFKEITISVTGA